MSAILKREFPGASSEINSASLRLRGSFTASSTTSSSRFPSLNAIVPVDEDDVRDTWTEATNQRRCDLIDLKFQRGLTPDEARELAQLQALLIRQRQRVAPLPIDDAQRLYEELLNAVNGPGALTDS